MRTHEPLSEVSSRLQRIFKRENGAWASKASRGNCPFGVETADFKGGELPSKAHGLLSGTPAMLKAVERYVKHSVERESRVPLKNVKHELESCHVCRGVLQISSRRV